MQQDSINVCDTHIEFLQAGESGSFGWRIPPMDALIEDGRAVLHRPH
jgi:hypothetical protein